MTPGADLRLSTERWGTKDMPFRCPPSTVRPHSGGGRQDLRVAYFLLTWSIEPTDVPIVAVIVVAVGGQVSDRRQKCDQKQGSLTSSGESLEAGVRRALQSPITSSGRGRQNGRHNSTNPVFYSCTSWACRAPFSFLSKKGTPWRLNLSCGV